jgi:hypothetical protein
MSDAVLGLVLVILSCAGLWLPLSRPSLGDWVARRPFASEWLALAVVTGVALGATLLISSALGR